MVHPGNSAMSPQAEGKMGTHHTYTVEKSEGWVENPETLFEDRTALQQT